MTLVVSLAGGPCLYGWAPPANAWGDAGHEVIATIADHYLDPAVRARVETILSSDRSRLTVGTDIASEATWADRYRDSDRASSRVRYIGTRNWHFVNLELEGADLASACFGQPPLPSGAAASTGPAADCVVDKIDEFVAELRMRGTGRQERLMALQFVLHLVGDLHQPLHSCDNHDEGGNEKFVTAPGIEPSRLHSAWDTAFVLRLGNDERQIADSLIARITPALRSAWSSGTPAAWAWESFTTARRHAYGLLPAASSPNHYRLSAAYVSDAVAVTAEQLSKAGVRLAYVLNRALR